MKSHPLDHLQDFDKMSLVAISRGKKYPSSKGWQNTPPGERGKGPDGSYGVLTGRGFFVLDVDHAHGKKSGHATLALLESKYGALPETFTVRTPTGGLHLYFLGDAKTGTNIPGKDCDIRGGGGQVLGPGSIHPDGGIYEVENDAQMVAAPEWLAALCRSRASTGPAPREAMALPKTPGDLKKTVQRKVAPSAVFWRDICRGVFPAGLPEGGGWNDHLTKVTHWLACQKPDWCEVSGETIAGLMGPSLSHMHARRREKGQDIDHLSASAVASMYNRAAQKIRIERQAASLAHRAIQDAKDDVTTPPRILQYKNAYWIADPSVGGYAGPYIRDQLWAAARDMAIPGVELHRPTPQGLVRMKPEDLIEIYGRKGSLDEVVYDLTVQEASVEKRILTLPATLRPDIEAKDSPEVDLWLSLLGGDPLKDWIAVSLDLRESAPALWISGIAGIGKTLIVRGLAQMWGADAPTPLDVALGKYNARLAVCPIVDGQEKIPTTWRGQPRLDDLKTLITDTKRVIEEKYTPNVTLTGAVRVILSSNNLDMIRGAGGITKEDAKALEERLVHIHVTDPAVRKYLEKFEVQEEWIDGGVLAAHFLHIAQTRKPARGKRLRLPAFDAQNQLNKALRTYPGNSFWIFKTLIEWISMAAKAKEAPQDTRIIWWKKDQTLRVTAGGLQSRLEAAGDRVGVKTLGQNLRRISNNNLKTTKIGEKTPKMWVIPLDILEYWLESEGWGSAEELREDIQCLNNRPSD